MKSGVETKFRKKKKAFYMDCGAENQMFGRSERQHRGCIEFRWNNNVRTDCKEICVNARNYSAQAKDYSRSIVKAALNFRTP